MSALIVCMCICACAPYIELTMVHIFCTFHSWLRNKENYITKIRDWVNIWKKIAENVNFHSLKKSQSKLLKLGVPQHFFLNLAMANIWIYGKSDVNVDTQPFKDWMVHPAIQRLSGSTALQLMHETLFVSGDHSNLTKQSSPGLATWTKESVNAPLRINYCSQARFINIWWLLDCLSCPGIKLVLGDWE